MQIAKHPTYPKIARQCCRQAVERPIVSSQVFVIAFVDDRSDCPRCHDEPKSRPPAASSHVDCPHCLAGQGGHPPAGGNHADYRSYHEEPLFARLQDRTACQCKSSISNCDPPTAPILRPPRYRCWHLAVCSSGLDSSRLGEPGRQVCTAPLGVPAAPSHSVFSPVTN